MNELENMRKEELYKERLISRESNREGLRGAVNAMCINCIYDPHSGGGTWKQQIRNCTSTSCPLHKVRVK